MIFRAFLHDISGMRFDAFDVGSRRINGVRNFQAGAGIAALRVIHRFGAAQQNGSTFGVRGSPFWFVVLVRRSSFWNKT